MQITLNGEPHQLDAPLTVSELLQQLQIDARRVAVELNLVVLKRAAFETAVVNEGDQVEVVNFVGGGSGIRDQGSGLMPQGSGPMCPVPGSGSKFQVPSSKFPDP